MTEKDKERRALRDNAAIAIMQGLVSGNPAYAQSPKKASGDAVHAANELILAMEGNPLPARAPGAGIRN